MIIVVVVVVVVVIRACKADGQLPINSSMLEKHAEVINLLTQYSTWIPPSYL